GAWRGDEEDGEVVERAVLPGQAEAVVLPVEADDGLAAGGDEARLGVLHALHEVQAVAGAIVPDVEGSPVRQGRLAVSLPRFRQPSRVQPQDKAGGGLEVRVGPGLRGGRRSSRAIPE